MNAAELLSTLVARGIEFRPHGDKLRFRPVERLAPEELEAIRQHKFEILALLQTDEKVSAAMPPSDEMSEAWPELPPSRFGGLCTPPSQPFDPQRFDCCLERCDRCGSALYSDIPIHNGRSLRRDCAACHRFMGWPRWYDQLFDSLN